MTNLLMAVMLPLAAIPSQTAPSQAEQFDLAYQRSFTTGRPLVVLLGAQWCPGCQVMQHEVMPEVEKSGGLEQVEFVYIDIDRNRRLAAKLSKAKTIPQLIRYHKTPDGWKYNLLNGAYNVEEVKTFIKTGIKKAVFTAKAAVNKKEPRFSTQQGRQIK